MKKLVLLAFVLLAGNTVWSQTLNTALETITSIDIQKQMQILAGEAMEGRKTGEPGIKRAAEYITGEFSRLGLKNPCSPEKPYIQEYSLYRSGWDHYFFVQGTDTVKSDRDLMVQGNVPALSGSYDFVFAGFGIDHPKYNNYRNLNVKGKIVIYLIGEPKSNSGKYITTGTSISSFTTYDSKKDSIAFSKGAVSTIRIDPADQTAKRVIRSAAAYGMSGMMSMTPLNRPGKVQRGYVYTTISAGAKVMGVSEQEITTVFEELKTGKKSFTPFSGQVTISSTRYPETVIAENLAGFLEGTDLKDELVVLTAHYDHLGIGSTGIRYGADDNASGTIGILEVAEAFAKAAEHGIRPRRSILFLPVSGEELGLLGSQYYVKHPIFPLDKTVAAVNMDMIGRRDDVHEPGQKYVYVYLSGNPGEWLDQVEQKAFASFSTDLKPEFQFRSTSKLSLGGSDHMSFEAEKVPVVYFFNGLHPDYHKPADTWDKILYEQMQETTRLVFMTVWEIANTEQKK